MDWLVGWAHSIGLTMNRREMLLSTIGAAVASQLPAVEDSGWTAHVQTLLESGKFKAPKNFRKLITVESHEEFIAIFGPSICFQADLNELKATPNHSG